MAVLRMSPLELFWATDNGAQVINLSLGGASSSTTLQDAVNYAYGKGVLLVAAAGNTGSNFVLYPARYPNVIAVGAVDNTNNHAGFSNFGPELDLVAPGASIYSTVIGGYGYKSGTSMAAPYVSGLAAILRGYPLDIPRLRSLLEMESSALDLGVPGFDNLYGYRTDPNGSRDSICLHHTNANIYTDTNTYINNAFHDPRTNPSWRWKAILCAKYPYLYCERNKHKYTACISNCHFHVIASNNSANGFRTWKHRLLPLIKKDRCEYKVYLRGNYLAQDSPSCWQVCFSCGLHGESDRGNYITVRIENQVINVTLIMPHRSYTGKSYIQHRAIYSMYREDEMQTKNQISLTRKI